MDKKQFKTKKEACETYLLLYPDWSSMDLASKISQETNQEVTRSVVSNVKSQMKAEGRLPLQTGSKPTAVPDTVTPSTPPPASKQAPSPTAQLRQEDLAQIRDAVREDVTLVLRQLKELVAAYGLVQVITWAELVAPEDEGEVCE